MTNIKQVSLSRTAWHCNGVQGKGCPGKQEKTPTAHGSGMGEADDRIKVLCIIMATMASLIAVLVAVLLPQASGQKV